MHDKAQVLPGSGVDLQRFAPSRKRSDATFTFVMVSRLLKSKGVQSYLEAARDLLRDGSRGCCAVQFVLVGIFSPEHPQAVTRAELAQYREALGARLVFHENAIAVEEILADCDCLVLPTEYNEGVPRSLIEGAACGLPLIATDVPACREVITPEWNGLVYAPGEGATGLGRAMAEFIQRPHGERERMGANSRKRAVEKFDERYAIEPYLDVFRDAG